MSGGTGVATSVIGVGGTASASPGQIVTLPATGPASPVPPGIIRAGHSGEAHLGVPDNGVTVILHPGQSVLIVLGGTGMAWDPPRVTGSGSAPVLRQSMASGGYPSALPARARFRAVRAGRVTISSATDAACLHTQPACEIAQQLWEVRVIVRR